MHFQEGAGGRQNSYTQDLFLIQSTYQKVYLIRTKTPKEMHGNAKNNLDSCNANIDVSPVETYSRNIEDPGKQAPSCS